LRTAAARAEPIPVYAEMSSINPVFLMPNALAPRAEDIAQKFVGSLTLGAGQFCTNPGLIFGIAGASLDKFLAAAKSAVEAAAASTMLTPGICKAYQKGVARLASTPKVEKIAEGAAQNGPNQGQAALFVADAAAFTSDESLSEEVFGAASLVIRCPDIAAMRTMAEKLEGQLTATIQMDKADTADARSLLPILERRVGRILVNGYPTGVEVSNAMVHGGPYPATSDGRTTSVGTLAIRRFLRPVCYQDVPDDLLPASLRDENTLNLWRRIDGAMGQR
jgi:NADP-dependent aldehyde dehydrogenase